MKPDASHIREIHVVSNTHWDREFRRSFERTRRMLLDMFDITLDLLDRDPAYHSFTCDGHCILVEDYLEMRPERRPLVERLAREGRLILGPWYTLPEVLSIGDEALARNFLWAQKTCRALGCEPMPVGYTPASWGQTGQLPQIMANFGVDRIMFYRGISHHEADAEYWWEAPDGTRTLASRFALYARYNWYYLVHRVVTTGDAFNKIYEWSEHNETPMRIADGLAGPDASFELLHPEDRYDRSRLAAAIEEMVRLEGPHFTTPFFLAMNGHDISVAFPRESEIYRDANEVQSHWKVIHTNLMEWWARVAGSVDAKALPTLKGERRSALKRGMWTYLLPGSVSARTYLKIQDFETHNRLAGRAEPLATLAAALGAAYPALYLERAWRFLLTNHTHDANGGCAPDRVCLDMEYRYRQSQDCADIVTEDAMRHIARSLDPGPAEESPWRLLVVNPLAQARRELVEVELELPAGEKARSLVIRDARGRERPWQFVHTAPSGVFVDSIWEVPRMAPTTQFRVLVDVDEIPPVGYTALSITPSRSVDRRLGTLATGPATLDNEFLTLRVNPDGTADLHHKKTRRTFRGLNAFRDQGEIGTAWFHQAPPHDEIFLSAGAPAQIALIEDGPLRATIRATVTLTLPREGDGEERRSAERVPLVIETFYTVRREDPVVSIRTALNNTAKDHWLRVIFPTGLETDHSSADSHFDVVDRAIEVPASDDWVEQAVGTHPLRTFVSLSDGKAGLSVFTRGLFEYEVLREEGLPVAISLLRSHRIKLLVSEEKKQVLPDTGPLCLGPQEFHYALYAHTGDWDSSCAPAQARRWATPVRCAQVGRGQGALAWRDSLFSINREDLVVTAVKRAEAGGAVVVRLFNPSDEARRAQIVWRSPLAAARLARMDETPLQELRVNERVAVFEAPPKKILTLLIEPAPPEAQAPPVS